MKTIYIIGAGQLGSRHLQALKNVKGPLCVKVIDPSRVALQTAKERYESMPGDVSHEIEYLTKIKTGGEPIDLAIVVTNSNVRRQVIEELLGQSKVKYFVLEKLLFQKKADYGKILKLLKKSGSRAWVNCSMRNMPFYAALKDKINGARISYFVTGSQYGLVTNSIHYIDHMAYLAGDLDYTVDASGLDKKPIKSKRKGFLELNGTININFKNGSSGSLICYPTGAAPVAVEIHSEEFRCISRESENKAWIASKASDWNWKEVEVKIPYQSEATANLVKSIFKCEDCVLVSLEDSVKLHLPLLEALKKHLNQNSKTKIDHYPFT